MKNKALPEQRTNALCTKYKDVHCMTKKIKEFGAYD